MNNLMELEKNLNEACNLMKVLSNPERMLLLCKLSKEEKNVSELEVELNIKQPTLSQQLTVLRNEKLVETRRDGKSIYYKLKDDKALAVMNTIYNQFCIGGVK